MTALFSPFMGSMDALSSSQPFADTSKGEYIVPALKNLGTVTIPILREVVAPASFRNEDVTITDIEHSGTLRVRAVANKFKFGERARGLQVLRHFGAGGVCAQNKTEIGAGQTAGDVFDLNTILFGDSTDAAKKVLPIKAAASYSDAVSIQPYDACVDKTFHNRAFEDGTLYNAEKQENSNNLFERHFVKPGTMLIQVITFTGRTAPIEALDHLLLSIGLAGAYGGQTSIYGVNVRNHILGIYGGRLERDVNSPYAALDALGTRDFDSVEDTVAAFEGLYGQAYATKLSAAKAREVQQALITRLEQDDADLRRAYTESKTAIKGFFDEWFRGIDGGKAAKK